MKSALKEKIEKLWLVNINKCLELCLEQIKNHNNESFLYEHAAKGYNHSNKSREALNILEHGIAKNPSELVLLKELSDAYILIGQIDKATALLIKRLEINPAYISAIHNLGTILQMQYAYLETMHWFDRALTIDSQFTPSLIMAFRYSVKQNNLQKAVKHGPQLISNNYNDNTIYLAMI